MFEHIPEELKALPQWVCWRSKIPYNPRTGKGAKARQPDTWATFEEAVQAANRYDGIGFEFNKNGLVGIDLDTVRDPVTGWIDPLAAEIIAQIDSYTEISPSGYGFHIIAHASDLQLNWNKHELPANQIMRLDVDPKTGEVRQDKGGNPQYKHPEIEMYIEGRYFTVTGEVYENHVELKDAIDAAQDLQQRFADKPTEQGTLNQNSVITATDRQNDYLAEGLKHDTKLRDLWYGDRPNRNESADDQALLNKLAYWLNCDSSEMKTAFLDSPHFASKDDAHQRKVVGRSDYLDRTIERAIKDCRNTAAADDAEYRAQKAKAVFAETQEWEPPIPLDSADVPPFPLDSLPDPIRSFVQAVAEDLQVPVDIPAVSALTIVALCVQGKLLVSPKSGWAEPLNLYAVNIAPPSERKSPVMKAMTAPVYEFMQNENDFREESIRAYETQKTLLEQRIASMTSAAAKAGKDSKVVFTAEDVVKAKKELADLEPVKPLRLLADDITQEALQKLMADNDGRMAVVSAEGGIFEIMAGRYTSSSINVEVFLKAFSGDPIFVDRVGRAPQQIPHPALTMLLSVQPVIIRDIMANSAFRGRGLLARFLFSQPKSKVGSRHYDTVPIPQEVKTEYRNLIHELLRIDGSGNVIRFDAEAHEVSRQFFYQLEPQHMNQLFEIEDWSGKFHGAAMRIAGLLHCMQYGHEAASCLVNEKTVRDAITIGEYFLEHAKAVFLVTSTTDTENAEYILRRLKAYPPSGAVSKRDLLRLCRKFHTADGMTGAINVLMDREYLREAPCEGYKGKGRKPEERYEINPFFLSS